MEGINRMKVLNLYAGIGGNRKLWEDVEVTAVELDPQIAAIYQSYFPNDKVIVGDAHQYLLDHYKEYDFIWASRPCPTHSRARYWGWSKKKPVYPDFSLYEEIVFLKHHYKGLYICENVIPYYEPLIPGIKIGRHMIWASFYIAPINHKSSDIRKLSGTSKKDKLKRNAVDPEIGLHILNHAIKRKKRLEVNQTELFIDTYY